jgi:hypothetical protein
VFEVSMKRLNQTPHCKFIAPATPLRCLRCP